MLRSIVFGGACRITDWRISGAYHELDCNILWAKKGTRREERRGRKGSEINYFGNDFILGGNFKKKMNWRISLAHSPAHM